MRYRIGTSGWNYKHWREVFYPPRLPARQWFSFYAGAFDTVEINATFYRMPSPETCDAWREQAPPGFCYAVKVSRFVTHIKRLRDCAEPMDNFLERARRLGEHLGPLLYQLPPSLHRDDALLAGFLELLPPGLSHVFEFRHASWFEEPVLRLLRDRGIAFCVHDHSSLRPPPVRTAPVAYVRLHGPSGRYAGNYPREQLETWAERIRELGGGAEAVYAYFNNDIGGHAVANARELREILEGRGEALSRELQAPRTAAATQDG